MVDAKLNPTLFEKLTQGGSVVAILDQGRTELQEVNDQVAERASLVNLDRYTESALRASVRRELNWLLNTTRLAASRDLTRFPQVQTSVLNYGLPDLTGRAATEVARQGRARDIETVIRSFEPRLDPTSVHVEARPGVGMDNAISFVIHGDISAAVKALPVHFVASVEVETGETVVKD